LRTASRGPPRRPWRRRGSQRSPSTLPPTSASTIADRPEPTRVRRRGRAGGPPGGPGGRGSPPGQRPGWRRWPSGRPGGPGRRSVGHPGRGVGEGRDDRARSGFVRTVEHAEAVQGSRGRGSRRGSGRSVERPVLGQGDQVGDDVPSSLDDQEALGVEPPEQCWSLLRAANRSFGVVGVEGQGRGSSRGADGGDPVESGRGFYRAAGSRRRCPCRSGTPWAWGVVLDDVVVPVADPDRAVGADLGGDGRGSTRRRWPTRFHIVVGGEVLPRFSRAKGGDEVAGRLGDKCHAVPVGLGIGPGGCRGRGRPRR